MSLRDKLSEEEPDLLFADGLDEAIIGVSYRAGGEPVVAYDYDRCIEILMEQGMESYDEALDYFDYNVMGAYVGARTPTFIYRRFVDE